MSDRTTDAASADVDTPQAVRLADYRPTDFATTHTHLTFDVREGATEVVARQQLERRVGSSADAPLVLQGDELELLEVALDGRVLSGNEYHVDAEQLRIFDLPAQCELTVRTRIYPERNTALEGLYKSGGMYCTQCEAEGFRRITFSQDRPDVLSIYTTTLIADSQTYPVMLANGNHVESVEHDDGRRAVTWHDPHPKPSYLFALVLGDLSCITDEFVTMSGRKVRLEIYSEPHNIDQCDYAMAALKRAMRWDEEVYGREYDLDIFMIVAVDDFNAGAMENKGLNLFNTSCVLATPDTATDNTHLRIEAIVAHEYFHNWSGNRVTCRDWFQLSLKEGFTVFRDAQFSADMNSATAKRIEDVNFLRAVQFAEDASPLAHAIRPDSYIEISNFYTPTVYEKGAEVVRMLHTCLGAEAFRRGSDLYFERHDGEAATTEDFVRAMESVSGKDLGIFRRWYEQAGTPELKVRATFDGNEYALTVTQSTPPTRGQASKLPTHVPVLLGLLDAQGAPLDIASLQPQSDGEFELRDGDVLLQLTSAQQTLRLQGLSAAPLVSFLRGFSAPVRVEFERERGQLLTLARHDTDGFARWDVLQSLLVEAVHALSADAPETGSALDADLVELYRGNLQEALDALSSSAPDPERLIMLAELLAVPGEAYLFEQVDVIDVHGLCRGRDRLQAGLAQALLPHWQDLYAAARVAQGYVAEPLQIAQRRLCNLALGYLCAADDPDAGRLLSHLADADNFTDRRAALVEIADAQWLDAAQRESALQSFFETWRHETLVANQWLQVMASNNHTDAAAARRLETHESYDQLNPNKLRALVGGFTQQNARNFHARDGAGYRFLADKILELNESNPQMASRVAVPLTRWRRFLPDVGARMRAEVERIAGAPDLSKDVFEVVSKSLDG